MKLKGLWSIGLLAASTVGVQAAVIYSTSFEAEEGYFDVPATSYLPYYGDGTMGNLNGGYTGNPGTLGNGWTVLPIGAKSGIDLVGDIWSSTSDSPMGQQWIDLIGTNGPGGIERAFNVVAGYTYTLSWYDYTNLPTTAGAVYALDFGSLSSSEVAGTAWAANNVSFVAASTGSAVLRFYSFDKGTGNTGIDGVEIRESSVPVPEPFTLLIAGAGLAAALRRNRKS